MFPYADYFQVFIIYLIIALALWIPPLILPQWKMLVNKLNEIDREASEESIKKASDFFSSFNSET